MKNVKYYADITKKKYDYSYEIIQTGEFTDFRSAEEFATIWGNSIIGGTLEMIYEGSVEFPIILVSVKFQSDIGSAPIIVVCDAEGNLTQQSKIAISLW